LTGIGLLLALVSAGPALADTASPPYWPTATPSLVATQGSNFIRVGGETGWAEATHTPPPFVGHYAVYRSVSSIAATEKGEYIGRVESTAAVRYFDDYTAIPGESYYYGVVAVDSAGRWSVESDVGEKILATAGLVTMPGSEVAHDAYNKNSMLCRDCHEVHGAAGPRIFRRSSEKEVCYTCHDGTGSIYDVRSGSTSETVSDFGEAALGSSTKTSYHPVPNASNVLAPDTGMECSDCHIAHKSRSVLPRLLAAAGPDGPGSGNAFCWTCHGTDSNADGYQMGGDHYTEYYNKAVHSAEKSLPLTDWEPASGTDINCENCHKSHGTGTSRLTAFRLGNDYTEESLCFGEGASCHGSASGSNMQDQFDPAQRRSYHAIRGTTGDGMTGAKVECSSCHGPHTVQSGADTKLTKPSNTKQLVTTTTAGWGGANFRTYFCNDCHKAGSFPSATTNSTTIVPYTITFPTVSGSPFFPGWDKNSYYYSSGHWLQSYSAGYDTVRDCAYCHVPHGSDNARLTQEQEEGTCYLCHDSSPPAGVNGAKDVKSETTATVTLERMLFATPGGNTNFRRYSITSNSWDTRASSSTNFNAGTALVWDGGDYIYATHGGGTTFRRFQISSNTWENRASTGVNAGEGASLEIEGNYIYYFRGANTNKALRYTISTNAWSDAAMADVNVGGTNYSLARGADSTHITGDDYIYVMQGNGQTRFLRYSISGNTYTTRATTPAAPDRGGQIEWAGGSQYLYALRGNSTTFWRYDIGANSWSDAAVNDTPGNIGDGGSLAWDGGSYIWALRGGGANNLYRFNISGNSWTNMNPSNAFNVNAGGAMTRADDDPVGGGSQPTAHPVATVSDRHSDTETAGNLGSSNRHSECVDCHDPHRATRSGTGVGKALHVAGTPYIGPALIGAWGVSPTSWPAAWTVATSYNLFRLTSAASQEEWQLCFRCHTYYAYGGSPPTSPSGGFTETDLSKDFNVNNAALHPVTAVGKNDFAYSGGGNYRAALINGWLYNSRMTCTDCHNTNNTIDSTVPGGPHGSANSFILKRPWDSYTGTGNTYNPGDSSDLCFLCHDYTTYVTGNDGTNLNTGFRRDNKNLHLIDDHNYYQKSGGVAGTCINCHGAIPHGLNRAHSIVLGSDPAPYNWNAGRSTYKNPNGTDSGDDIMTTFVNRDNQDYDKNDCQKSGGGHPC